MFTTGSVGVGSIIVDLFARDAGAALGREDHCTVRGRERGKYLRRYTWLL